MFPKSRAPPSAMSVAEERTSAHGIVAKEPLSRRRSLPPSVVARLNGRKRRLIGKKLHLEPSSPAHAHVQLVGDSLGREVSSG